MILAKAMLFYATAGVIIGAFVASMDTVNFRVKGHPVRFPRLAAGLVAGLIWPAVMWLILFQRQPSQ